MEKNLDGIFIDLSFRNYDTEINLRRMELTLDYYEKDLKRDFDIIKEKYTSIPKEDIPKPTITKIHINKGGTSEWITNQDSTKTEDEKYYFIENIYSNHKRYLIELKDILSEIKGMINSNTDILDGYKSESIKLMRAVKENEKFIKLFVISLIANFFLLIEFLFN